MRRLLALLGFTLLIGGGIAVWVAVGRDPELALLVAGTISVAGGFVILKVI